MNLQDLEEFFFFKELNKLSYNFLWNGKNDKIRSGVCRAYEVGGLKIVDIKSILAALKISWLKHILHDDGKLKKILQATDSECKTTRW